MVHSCIVEGCKNRSNNPQLSWHRIPVLQERSRLIMHQLSIPKSAELKHARICSQCMEKIPKVRKPPRKCDEVMATKKRLTRDELRQNITHDHTYSLPIEEAPVVVDPSCASHIGLDEEIQLTELSTMPPDAPIIDTSRFCIEMFIDDDQGIRFYTSFPTYNHFIICYNFLGDAVNCLHYPGSASSASRVKTQCSLSPQNEFFLTLCRLRCGLLEQDLAYRFKISQSTSNCIKNLHCMDKFSVSQQLTFSLYKNHNTAKALAGITPCGTFSFISPLYGGSISDRQLFIESGLIDKLDTGDADRGFNIADLLSSKGDSKHTTQKDFRAT